MQVRTYAKNNSVSLDDVIETLKGNFQGVWLKTSNITDQHIDYLNNVFGISQQKQLPPSASESPKQLPQAETVESGSITQTVSESLETQSGNSNGQSVSGHLTVTNKLETAINNLEIQRVQLNLDNQFETLVNTLNAHDRRVEGLLMSRLRSTYESVATHQVVQPSNRSSEAALSEFDKMMSDLQARGIDIKS